MKILFLNQSFHPDVVASAQYLADLASALAARGHHVTVVASRHSYDDPRTIFKPLERLHGVNVLRLPGPALGRNSTPRRIIDAAAFILLAFLRILFLPRQDLLVSLTSPPFIGLVCLAIARLRKSHFVHWTLDLNPDEAFALGFLQQNSLPGRSLEHISRYLLKHADHLIALDRFMQARLVAKGLDPRRIHVVPPWAQLPEVKFQPQGRVRFRLHHALDQKFVVMYSGNHSPCHPLDTLLRAASALSHDPQIIFCFIGGGTEFHRIHAKLASPPFHSGFPSTPCSSGLSVLPSPPLDEPGLVADKCSSFARKLPSPPLKQQGRERVENSSFRSSLPSPPLEKQGRGRVENSSFHSRLPSPPLEEKGWGRGGPIKSLSTPPSDSTPSPNILCLPYQPRADLAASLSAADLHIVVMGQKFVGILHPCKIYNILAVGIPVIYIGPTPSPVSDALTSQAPPGSYASLLHGDVLGLVKQIQIFRENSMKHPRFRRPPASTLGASVPNLVTLLESFKESPKFPETNLHKKKKLRNQTAHQTPTTPASWPPSNP